MDPSNLTFNDWHMQLQSRHEIQQKWIQHSKENPHLDDDQIRRLDSTLKKVTAFMKRVKTIGSTVSPESLLPELTKLNLSKFIDEIASSVCDAKVKIEELPPLVEFCVKAASIYSPLAENLVSELKKRVPTRKSDEISNASKLRVDLRFISDLILSGVIDSNGIQLFGSVLSFVLNTDKEHVNVSIILPFCQTNLFDCTGMIPLSCQKSAANDDLQSANSLLSPQFSSDQRAAFSKLVTGYVNSLIDHLSNVRAKMNATLKSIKRQERTKGDALPEDRHIYEEQKTLFNRLHANALDLCQWTGIELPEMPEELSDDEVDEMEVKKLQTGNTEPGTKLFQDDDTRSFYEKLVNVEQVAMTATRCSSPSAEDELDEETSEFSENKVENLVENVNVSDLENDSDDESEIEEEMPEEDVVQQPVLTIQDEKANATREQSILNPLDNAIGISLNINMFLNKLFNAINKERIDAAALEFIGKFNTKGNRKRLVQHLLAAPHDRLDLLPFYCRFMATIKPAIPDVPLQVERALLEIFRQIANKKFVAQKGRKSKELMHVDVKVHLAKYISEFVKFGLLPCAEGLSCLRSLLVDLKQHKVDMLCAMIESMGYFLYNLPETHSKMKVIVGVLMTKTSKIKDERQRLLLENAYFSVLPPNDEDAMPLQRRPPLEDYILSKVIVGSRPVGALRRLNWADEEVVDFAMNLLADPCSVPFEKIERLAKIVGGLSDYHDWIGIFVVDDVIEYIRLALEINDPAMHQRLFSSVVYIGQLYNYTLCGNPVVFKILYQLISFGINNSTNTVSDCALRIRRIRLAIELVRTVAEYFSEKRPKERMDCFLNYLFLFYYESINRWTEHAEEYGEFPQDIGFELSKLLAKYRPKEKSKFAKSLEEAQSIVIQMQEKYKDQAEDLLKQTSQFNAPLVEQEDERPKKAIREDEDDDEENTPTENTNDMDGQTQNDNFSSVDLVGKFEDDELSLAEKQHEIMPEDEDFLRDLDRAIMETFQNASAIPKAPIVDLEVPPSVRQKFERKLTFADDTKTLSESVDAGQSSDNRVQMALMIKKGNRPILKSVNLEPTQGMHEALMEQKAIQKKQRDELKKLTLALDKRMTIQQQEEGAASKTSQHQSNG